MKTIATATIVRANITIITITAATTNIAIAKIVKTDLKIKKVPSVRNLFYFTLFYRIEIFSSFVFQHIERIYKLSSLSVVFSVRFYKNRAVEAYVF